MKRLAEIGSSLLGLSRRPSVRWAFGVLAVGLAVWAVAIEREAVLDALRRLEPRWVAAAIAATLLNVALAGMVWRTLLADLGSKLPYAVAARIYFVGQLGKYVPGSVWPIVMQAELGRDHHVPRFRTATATVVSLLLGVASALFVVLLALPFDSTVVPNGFGWAVILIVPLLIMLHPRVIELVVNRVLTLMGREPMKQRATLRGTAIATLWAIGSWTGAGLQIYALSVSLGAEPGAQTAALAIGGYALAWAAGFLVLVAPAGAGARELALAAVLAPVLDRGAVLVVVLMSRVLFTSVDLLAAAGGLAVGHRHRQVPLSDAEPAADPDPDPDPDPEPRPGENGVTAR